MSAAVPCSIAALAGRRGAPAGEGGDAAPRAVTRGESPEHGSGSSAVHVDWLNATFPAPSISAAGLVSLLSRMLGRPVSADEGRGMLGFERSLQLVAHHAAERSTIGCIAFGGESQAGRWLLQLTGVGCQFVTDWPGLRDLLESLGAKLTRVDLALDFLGGEYGVDDALQVHEMGGFNGNGHPPSTSVAGDWLDGKKGRTLYIGRAVNGKMLRVYEKGRQLGDPDSDWTRFEVQLGNRDRVIPFDVLTDRDAFFAGAYPALEGLVAEAARKVRTQRTEGTVTLAHLWHHLRRCYGAVIHTAGKHAGATHAELIEGVTITALPRRLNPSSLAAGVIWADVHAQAQRLAA